jgi:glyoxylase-like metal-dependent hydrolase (beta-lactamase superfamily II)
MRIFVRLAAVLALASGGVGRAAAQQNFDSAQIVTQQVAPGIYMLIGPGGNIGVSAGEDGVFLIDDQYAPLTERVLAALAAITDEPVRFVLNTHWHQDHTGGNENLGGAGALIVAHENVRVRMSVEQMLEFGGQATRVPPSPKAALPVVTFAEDVTLHLNGHEIHAFHVDHAHTDGDAIVHFRDADVVHMGDVYFNGGFPFIDTSSGGSIDGVIAAVDETLALIGADTKVIPGHGPLATRADLAAYGEGLRTMRRLVAELVDEGHPIEHILDFRPIEAQARAWGVTDPAEEDAFVETIYRGLTAP